MYLTVNENKKLNINLAHLIRGSIRYSKTDMYTMNIEHQTGGASARFHSCLRAIVRNSRAIFGNQQTLSCEITTVVLLLIKLCFRLGITVSNGAQMADIHCGGRAPQHYFFFLGG